MIEPRNWLNEQKKMRLKWAKEKHSCVQLDESDICNCRNKDTKHHAQKYPQIACICFCRVIKKIDEECRFKLI